MKLIQRFFRDETGSTAVEYALIAGLLAVALMVSLTALGDSLAELLPDAYTMIRITEF
jgi:pilus assembly protein Flp/PilA